MVSLISLLDKGMLSVSSQTVYLCDALDGCKRLAMVPTTDIYSVVTMFSCMKVSQDGDITPTGKYAPMINAYIEPSHFHLGDLFDEDNNTE